MELEGIKEAKNLDALLDGLNIDLGEDKP